MVRASLLVTLASLFGFASVAQAHPGGHRDEHADAIARRAEYLTATAESVKACSNSAEYAALRDAAIKRRSGFLSSLRRRALSNRRRDLATALNTNHKSNLTGLTSSTDPATLFGTSVKCLLAPDVTEGPYFVAGEPIRTSLTDGQAGLPLYLDLQFVDSKTCKPVPNLYINLWHANTTGVYSGVAANGNGNAADTTNLYRNNHRGIYPTDDQGVVQFSTSFPGHYTGRTTHIHLSTASGGTVLPNNTYSNAVYSHVGQLFFDQSLINTVEQQSAYAVNKQSLTLNSNDNILASSAANAFDPIVTYAYVNDDLSNGILGWISIAVDTSQVRSVQAAVFYSGNNTVANPGGGQPSGPGGAPGGSPPTSSPGSTPTSSPSASSSPAAEATPSPSSASNSSSSGSENNGTSGAGETNVFDFGLIGAMVVSLGWLFA